jgi:hypothetical protein
MLELGMRNPVSRSIVRERRIVVEAVLNNVIVRQ